MADYLTTTVGTVELVTLVEGYSKGIPHDGPFINKRYLIPWDQADATANALMGLSSSLSYTSGTIYRSLPHICPESPNLVCVGIGEIEGCGELTLTDGEAPRWTHAIVPASYGYPKYNMTGTEGASNVVDQNNYFTPTPGESQQYPFCTFTFDYSLEVLTLPGTSYKFITGTPSVGGKAVGYPVGVRIQNVAIGCSVKQVPWLPADEISTLIGSTNSATFFGKPAGTILFEGAKTTEPFTRDGTVLGVDIDLTFKYRSKGWNFAPLPTDGGSWYEITSDGTAAVEDGGSGQHPYPKADLRPLIFGVSIS